MPKPQPKDLDPYTDPRSFYGSELRRLREAGGHSQDQLGELVFCSGAYIGQLEGATRRPQLDLSKMLDGVLGSGEHLQRLCLLARESKVAKYFADAADLQQRATAISEYGSMLVPGLLQTEGYARALTRGAHPFAAQSVIEGHVSTRMERAELLDSPAAPVFWVITHEAMLRVPVGGPAVMHGQLTHLLKAAHARPHVVLQVMPFSAGPHPFLESSVCLMDFTDEPPVVYTEGAYTGQLVEEPALVAQFRSAYDLARAAALSPEASLALIESAAKDYTTHEHHT